MCPRTRHHSTFLHDGGSHIIFTISLHAMEGPVLCSQFSDISPSCILWSEENVNSSLRDRLVRINSANLFSSFISVPCSLWFSESHFFFEVPFRPTGVLFASFFYFGAEFSIRVCVCETTAFQSLMYFFCVKDAVSNTSLTYLLHGAESFLRS